MKLMIKGTDKVTGAYRIRTKSFTNDADADRYVSEFAETHDVHEVKHL